MTRHFLRFLKDFSPSVNVLELVFVLLTTASMMNMIFFNPLRGWQPWKRFHSTRASAGSFTTFIPFRVRISVWLTRPVFCSDLLNGFYRGEMLVAKFVSCCRRTSRPACNKKVSKWKINKEERTWQNEIHFKTLVEVNWESILLAVSPNPPFRFTIVVEFFSFAASAIVGAFSMINFKW